MIKLHGPSKNKKKFQTVTYDIPLVHISMSQNSRKNPSQEITIGFINLISSCQIGS